MNNLNNPELLEIGTEIQTLCLKIGQGKIDWERERPRIERVIKKLKTFGMTAQVKDLEEILEAINETKRPNLRSSEQSERTTQR